MTAHKISLTCASRVDACEACGERDGTDFIDPYLIESNNINQVKSSYEFFHHPAYCGNCGHIWNRTPPRGSELEDYYRNQLPHVVEDYDPDKRVEVLERLISEVGELTTAFEGMRLLDYGSNERLSFHQKLAELGVQVLTADVGDEISGSLAPQDIVTCYFMLEHSLNPRGYFKLIADVLDSDGLILVEVPDTRLYQQDCSGLLHEHQQHFQVSSMDAIAAKFGFANIYTSNTDCSRRFGFVAAYKRNAEVEMLNVPQDTRSGYIAARKMQLHISELIESAAAKVLEHLGSSVSQEVYFWGINDFYLRIRERLARAADRFPADSCVAIDLNPVKRNYVFGRDNFASPEEAKDLFENSESDALLFVAASSHWKQIIQSIEFKGRVIAFDAFDSEAVFREFGP